MDLKDSAVVFPGQGSQYIGMLTAYLDNHSSFLNTFKNCSDILEIDLIDLIKNSSEEKISKTQITQPLMLVSDVALWNLIIKKIRKPICVAGHSLGEFAALVASEVISLEDSLMLVKERSRLMQEAVPEGQGAIAAIIGLEEKIINHICSNLSTNSKYIVGAANLNSENQVVISGTRLGVTKAIEECKSSGAKRDLPLPMSIPAHSYLMKDAANKFLKILEYVEFKNPQIPVIHNFDALTESNLDKIKNKLSKQIYSPVRWLDTMKAFSNKGVKTLIECGPNKILTSLAKRTLPSIQTISLDSYNNYLDIFNNG